MSVLQAVHSAQCTEDSCPVTSLICCKLIVRTNGGSRNLVGIAIQLSDSEQEKLLVGYSMLISPEKFDFGVE